MKNSKARRRGFAVAASLSASLLVAAAPAAADCVVAEAYVELSGQRRYIVPSGTCVLPTPFREFAGTGPTSFGNGLVRVGGSATVPAPVNAPIGNAASKADANRLTTAPSASRS